jgi:hypothetical protein
MVQEGIVLSHKISGKGIEVDKAKIEAIERLPFPPDVKGIRSFLCHVGLYRRFIKNVSKVARPLTNLLQKNACVNFDEICFTTFNILEQDLLNAPFIKPLIGETLFIYFVMLVMKPLGLFFFTVIVMNLISLIMQVILSMNLKETTHGRERTLCSSLLL